MRICVQVSNLTEIKDVLILYGSKNVLITSEINDIFFQEISCQDFTSILASLVKLIIYHEGKKNKQVSRVVSLLSYISFA